MAISRRRAIGASVGSVAALVSAASAKDRARSNSIPNEPKASVDPEYRSAADLVTALQSKKVSSAELVQHAIKRIEALDGQLNAVVVRDFDQALDTARAADTARARGAREPLLGLPMTIKEAFNIEGLPTTWGIPGKKQGLASRDAVVAKRLKDAGAVILGKTNVPLMLSDWQTYNVDFGITNNPWDVSRTPGGSSGGSAVALAAGYVPLEFGTDIAGSLRVPAAFCGVFAHKPTWNVVPMRGAVPPGAPVLSLAPPLDLAVAGPMARSADDLALALAATAGPDDAEAVAYSLRLPATRHLKLRDFRIFVIDEHPLLPTESSIRAAIASLVGRLEKAGCTVSRADPKLPDLSTIGALYETVLMSFMGADLSEDEYARARSDAQSESAKSADRISAAIARGMVLSHRDWIWADRARTGVADRWRAFFRDWDVVICPVMPTVAFPHDPREMKDRKIVVDGKPIPYIQQSAWIGIATLTGQPATSVPIGTSKEGLPIGIQVIGPYLEDLTTIKFAGLLEREFGGFIPPPAQVR
ncbi:MAG TPA: amidase [Bradyrhizobium sp.]|jgi:amidase|nr:amidase [Bradyrhizobium sp.]